MWKIEKIVSKGDYLYSVAKEHPYATKHGYVLMHRIIMENHLCRLLNPSEVVHHKNGNKKDNSIKNLEVSSKSEHTRKHQKAKGCKMVELKCPNCEKIFVKRKGSTQLQQPKDYDCCCRRCRGQFSRQIQLHGKTAKVEQAISENIVKEFRSFDNSEQTD